MSIYAFGAFQIANADITPQERNELAFKTSTMAMMNRIGIRMGMSMWQLYYDEYKDRSDCLPFELIDDPITNDAQVLFIGDNVKLGFFNGHEITRFDSGEPLYFRMSGLQKFLEEALDIDEVTTIFLYIDSDYGEEFTVSVKAADFKESILELYEQYENEIPTIKFIIT
ncbi:MAG: hypothetical protein HN929_02090 [Chloroflexi bacterium]|jgi:hypothetical protein|nr:hypothetical protein [Chloroflexota bacterium]MBT7080251.1 hypothetical protein [Chloroflexota bacterium]MBT7289331.1 hypothetical protein [Chloroflexota bacterium]